MMNKDEFLDKIRERIEREVELFFVMGFGNGKVFR